MAKGGQTDEGHQTKACARNSLWPPSEGGKHIRAVEANGREGHIGEQSIISHEIWGGEVVTTRKKSGVNGWKTEE